MGIYIKGMEMPKDCIVCPFGWNGCNKQHDFVYMGSRPDFCPLIDVHEPHGRLIDADKLKEEFPHDEDWDYPVNTNSYVVETIDKSPTIIEAEEET